MPLIVPGITPNPVTDFASTSATIGQDGDKPCVEIGMIHLKPGYEKYMENFRSSIQRISAAPGFKGCRWGLRVEKDLSGVSGSAATLEVGEADVLEYFIDWETFKAHEDLMQELDYAENVLLPLTNIEFCASFETLHFFPTSNQAERSLPLPTKCIERNISSAQEDTTNVPTVKTIEVCTWKTKRHVDFRSFLDIHEDLENALANGPVKGVKAGPALEKKYVVVLLVGWDTVEAHYEWKKDSKEGQEALKKVRDIIDKVHMYHVRVCGEVAPGGK